MRLRYCGRASVCCRVYCAVPCLLCCAVLLLLMGSVLCVWRCAGVRRACAVRVCVLDTRVRLHCWSRAGVGCVMCCAVRLFTVLCGAGLAGRAARWAAARCGWLCAREMVCLVCCCVYWGVCCILLCLWTLLSFALMGSVRVAPALCASHHVSEPACSWRRAFCIAVCSVRMGANVLCCMLLLLLLCHGGRARLRCAGGLRG